jgi:hypothetical protein
MSLIPIASVKPGKRANQRLSVDLARFREALDRIEAERRDPGAAACTGVDSPAASPEEVRRYLDSIDECFGRFGVGGAHDDLLPRRSIKASK